MNEIEVLVRIETLDFNKVKQAILNVAIFTSKKIVEDEYYYDPLRKDLQPNEKNEIFRCFRLRKKEDKCFLTYKIDNFDEIGKWLFSEEFETECNNLKETKKIIELLGLKQLIEVKMIKEFYETKDYIIAIEFVEHLGVFLEVESKKSFALEKEIKAKRQEIMEFILELGFAISPDVGIGKPELLLKKVNGYEKLKNEKIY